MMRGAVLLAGQYKLVGVGRVKVKQVVMMGYNQFCFYSTPEPGGFVGVKVTGHPPFGFITVDGQKSNVDRKGPEYIHHTIVPERITGVVHAERFAVRPTCFDHKSHEFTTPRIIALQFVMRGRNTMKRKRANRDRLSVVQSNRPIQCRATPCRASQHQPEAGRQ